MIRRRWIWWPIVLVTLAIPIFAALAAQSFCRPHGSMIRSFAESHGKMVAALGIAADVFGNSALVEVLVNRRTSAFTVIITDEAGNACVVWNGDGWRTIPEQGI